MGPAVTSTAPAPLEPGTAFKVQFPFVMEVATAVDEDGPYDVPSWRPGSKHDDDGAHYHGVGFMILTVVSVHKPGNYPPRVFYTRKWIDPQGKTFGKNNLRVTSQGNFRRLVQGYRYRDREVSKRGMREAAEDLAKSLGITCDELMARMGLKIA